MSTLIKGTVPGKICYLQEFYSLMLLLYCGPNEGKEDWQMLELKRQTDFREHMRPKRPTLHSRKVREHQMPDGSIGLDSTDLFTKHLKLAIH